MKTGKKRDFSQGSVWGNILRMAIPMILAQLINLLYNVVDRIYIGHIPGADALAMTGVGLTLPVVSILAAFANLFGMGGAPLFSMSWGAGDEKHAQKIMGNAFSMLLGTGVVLGVACYLLRRPVLYLFGASDVTYPFADDYLTVYLMGTLFVMISQGMNYYINAQGFRCYRNADCFYRCGDQSDFGSHPDFFHGTWRKGCRRCYGDRSGDFCRLGAVVPDG